jgi:xanthine dehydrogenase accessory factor
MKEISKILSFYESLKKSANQSCALAIVVYVEGSSYRRTGARMLISENGFWEGGISGGCLEGDALKKARLAILKSKPNLVRYDTSTDDDHQIGVGLGCNGIIEVLFIPIDYKNTENAIEILKKGIAENTNTIVSVTKSEANPEFLGKIFNYTSTENLAFLSEIINTSRFAKEIESLKKSKNYNFNNKISVFVEKILTPIQVYIFGNQYDIYPLIELLKMLYWEIIIVSEPSKIKNSEGLTIINSTDFLPEKINENSACLLMSHSLETDKTNLRKLSNTKSKYIGMLGPKVRSERIISELKTEGVFINENMIFAPTGLDIGANTPEEIALSIIAEMKAVFNERDGGFLKSRTSPINERNEEIFKFN